MRRMEGGCCTQACALACICGGKSCPRGKMLVAVKKAAREELQKQQERKRSASENAEEGINKSREGWKHLRKRNHQELLPFSPLRSTFDIYSVTFNGKGTSAEDKDDLSLLISIHPLSQRASNQPHKLNIIPLLTNRLVKSFFPCLMLISLSFFLLYLSCFVHFCSMLAAV